MTRIARSAIWQNLPIAALGMLLLTLCGAVVVQKISWEASIVVGLFGTIGLAVAISILATVREDKHVKTFRETHPNQPWMWDARWQSDEIPSRSKWDVGGGAFATVITSLLAVPMFFQIPKELSDGNMFVLLGFLPIVVAVYFGRYTYRRWRSGQFEKSMSLFLETRPAALGAALSARLVMPSTFAIEDLKARLEHLKLVTTRDSEGTHIEKKVDLKVSARIESRYDADGQRVVGIAVDVPAGSLATSWGTESSDSYWDLVVDMRIAARDVSIRYEVPIADREQHSTLA